MMRPSRRWTLSVGAAVAALALTACGGSDTGTEDDTEPAAQEGAGDTGDDADDGAGELTGVFRLTAAECADGAPTAGSYFRMVQSGGTLEDGPFVENGDSACGDPTYTPLEPGTDGGLSTVDHQPAPDPAFDEGGNALASAIAQPAPFFAVGFGVTTNATDPQTELEVPVPSVTHDGAGSLTGDLSAWAIAYNGSYFNQGSPKPGGGSGGMTSAVSGTYDASTGAYVLEWTSQIEGGAFNGFTGVWHLEGTFEAS